MLLKEKPPLFYFEAAYSFFGFQTTFSAVSFCYLVSHNSITDRMGFND